VIGRGVLVPWLAVAGSLSACAAPHGGAVGTPAASARATPGASPTAANPHLPLLAVLDHPFGASPNTLRLVRADGGGEVAAIALDPEAEAVATAGTLVLVAGGGRLHVYAADGSSAAAVSLPGATPESLVRGLAGDPTGTHWLWASVVQSAGAATSTVYAAGPGTAPSTVASSTAPGSAAQPLAWTAGGPVLSDEPLGIGGYVLFRRTFGPTSLLDLGTRTTRPLTDSGCAFSDLAADGSLACVLDGREAPNDGGPVTLRITRPGRPPLSIALPGAVAQAGAAFFSPDARSLTLATSPALGEGAEQISMEMVDTASGARRGFGPAGLMPVAWLADGRVVAVRLPGVAGGDVGTYAVDGGGDTTLLSTASTVIGVLR
jgi:hypothetical protein